jgi:hypothetical protein
MIFFKIIFISGLLASNVYAMETGTDGRGGFFYATDQIKEVAENLANELEHNKTEFTKDLSGEFGAFDISLLINAIRHTYVEESFKVDIKRGDLQGRIRPLKMDYRYSSAGDAQVLVLANTTVLIEAQLDDRNKIPSRLIRKIEYALIKEASHFFNLDDMRSDKFARAGIISVKGFNKQVKFESRIDSNLLKGDLGDALTDLLTLFKDLHKQFPQVILKPQVILESQNGVQSFEVWVHPSAAPAIKNSRGDFKTDKYQLIFTKNIFGVANVEIGNSSIVGEYENLELINYCRSRFLAGDEEFLDISDYRKLNSEFNIDTLDIFFSPSSSIEDDEEFANIKMSFQGGREVSFMIEAGDDDYGSSALFRIRAPTTP